MHADVISKGEDTVTLTINRGVKIILNDRYNWDHDTWMNYPELAGLYIRESTQRVLDYLHSRSDLIKKTINDIGFNENDKQKLVRLLDEEFGKSLSESARLETLEIVRAVSEKLIGSGDLNETDFNLLKKLGAKEFEIYGTVFINQSLDITV